MRKISLAFALIGAVVAGCGGSSSGAKDDGGQAGGGDTFKVTIQNGQDGNDVLAIKGGTVVSAPAGISCGVGLPAAGCTATFPKGTTVVLTATATVAEYSFKFWAGDCANEGACTLAGNADKYLVAVFGKAGERIAHPNFTAATTHAPKFLLRNDNGAFRCSDCHSTTQTVGIIPGCNGCHSWPLNTQDVTNYAATNVGDHFRETAAFDMHGTGWSQACQRCHTDQGYRDYIGVLAAPAEAGVATDNHLDGLFLSSNPNTTNSTAAPTADQYAWGPLKCGTCHNSKFGVIADVRLPSTGNLAKLLATTNTTKEMNPLGLATTISVDTATALCAQCHQGRESTASANQRIASAADPTKLDDVIGTGTFINPHYAGAFGTIMGAEGKMWVEYPSKIYSGRNTHGGKASCVDCHDAHTGHLPADRDMPTKCGACHFDEVTGQPVASFVELEESRQFGFEGDVDGDGTQEPLKAEVEGLETVLYVAMREYATTVVGTSICYDGGAHPYMYKDNGAGGGTANDGICQDGEKDPAVSAQRYNQFTPRLLRASMNYKWAHAEAGAWAHNPRYVVEVLFDAITDLKAGIVAKKVAGGTAALTAQAEADVAVAFRGFRSFDGHFGGARAAAPYRAFLYSASAWSADGQPVSANQGGFSSAACYQCHGGQVGLSTYLADPTGASLTTTKKVTGFECSTCHTTGEDMKGIRSVTNLYFPPQKATQTVIAADTLFPKAADRVCATCHSGRESKATLETAIGATLPDAWTLGFTNPHYLGAAGVMFGDQTKMLYQYDGKTYATTPAFFGSPHGSPHGQSCTGCHQPVASKHTFEIDRAYCDGCHVVKPYGDFRLDPPEINVARLEKALYKEIQAYAQAAVTAAVPGANEVCYNPAKHPYWYVDAVPQNAAGAYCGAEDTASAKLNPQLLKAAFNFKWVSAEPGAGAHNYEYATQILIDSIKDLNPAATLPCDAKADGNGLIVPGTCDANGVGTPEIARP